MKRVRVIPVLLIHDGGLSKSVKFKDHKYVGDPINAVKIFNEKEVDEIVVLDIDASRQKRKPDLARIREIASEAFIPLAYGGGITSIDQVKDLFYIGIEKVIINQQSIDNPQLITSAASIVGSQSVVVSIDVKKDWLGRYRTYTGNGQNSTGKTPVDHAKDAVAAGAGEVFLNSIDRDGTFSGFDLELVRQVSAAVDVPVIACGGAASLNDFSDAITAGASAVAAGSYFVFQRPHKAVLISYPTQEELRRDIFEKINANNHG